MNRSSGFLVTGVALGLVQSTGWMKFIKDTRDAQRMNNNDFGDPLTFPVAPAAAAALSSDF